MSFAIMKILHITNDYSGSTVYKNLIIELDRLGLSQIVYNPIRESYRVGRNEVDFNSLNSRIIYSHILNKSFDRFLYKSKISKLVKDIESKIRLSEIDFIHAHTWYSDGGAAYLLSKKYNIPYIIAVRNTDLNVHYKYLIYYRNFGLNILKNARRIILIGEYQRNFFASLKAITPDIKRKIEVVPNGVDSFWIKHFRDFRFKPIDGPFNILYIGTFLKRKRLLELQEALIKLNINNDFKLHIVGGGGNASEKVLENITKYPNLFEYYGRIEDRIELAKIFDKCHIFAMPSRHETFGLVYVEALLMGLPILYTLNDGIDGFYNENIGEKVFLGDVREVIQKLVTLRDNYMSYLIPTAKLIERHDWKNIALTYKKFYSSIA